MLLSINRVCPGGSLLWLQPFRTASIVFAPLFPFKGQMGYYFAKFSRMSTTSTRFELGIICFCSLQKLWQHLHFLYRLLERPSNLLAFGCGSYQSHKHGSNRDIQGPRGSELGTFYTRMSGGLRLVQYEPLNIYGPNIVGTDGTDWKRHRTVANSAFNEVSWLLVYAVQT
jgi:hypothetical protein